MSIKELYTKGTKVWLPDPANVWKCATLLEDYKEQKELNVQLEDGKEVKVKVPTPADLPNLRNPEVLIGENDLTSLSYLHEPAVLYNLQVRFCERNYIYTYCGIVLVAFNPYQQLPIYDNGTIRAYSGQDMTSMDPHIFAIAEEAYKRMSRFEENQSIIVSGESGAGKTVSAKYAMRYFATVCGAENETQIEKRVLATNPIMEAIGNAKTTRNDNSSRFGKYIEIGFSKNEHILGANMRTYLLEKSRVVFQAPEERNYHIFYQLCSAADDESFKQYHLDSSEEFFYTNQGSSTSVDSISDTEDFLNFCQALNLLGLNPMKQSQIFRILAGILHLGNIQFKEDEKVPEASCVPNDDKHMAVASKLFGVDREQLRFWLCNKKMITVNETLSVPLSVAQAVFSRDALSKHIYSNLFLWIVSQLNKSLSPSTKMSRFIGVLDIYGFETFEVNSFEQFCINYANEKLQQQFCLHVFKLEQEEYVREQIEWSFIDFHDNQSCINLIESKLGILDLLDEECKMVNGSDENWCRKLYEKHSKNKHFSKPRMSQVSFIIHHFADDVEYQIFGFLEKNRDKVLEENINIFKASEYELIAELFQDSQQQPSGGKTPGAQNQARQNTATVRPARGEGMKSFAHIKQHSKTVGSQFSESLNLLMETLFSTTPHYVRCIKPNDSKLPFSFDPIRSVQQLRACGVLETIRISAAGYPSRWTYADFFKRYRVLAVSKQIVKTDLKKTCENLLNKLIQEKDRFQFGKTKIFFRAGQVAYLEKLRSDKLRACSILMQKIVRGWLARRRYKKIQVMVRKVQKFGKGLLARRKAEFLRRSKAATKIRSVWLAYRQKKKYQKMRHSIIFVQSYARALMGRKNFRELNVTMRLATIQRCVRGWYCRRKYRRVVRGITKMQGLVRRMIAKKKLRQLKTEAKSVEHIKTVAKGLENKIIELQQKLDERAKEVSVLKEEQVVASDLKVEVQKLRSAKESSSAMASQVGELEQKIVELLAQLEGERKEKERLLQEKEAVKKEKDDLISNLNNERVMLKEQLETTSQELNAYMENQEDVTKKRIDDATAMLSHEIEMERTNHQRLIKEHNRLQQRLENMESDRSLYLGTPRARRHRRTPSNLSEFSIESESSAGDKDIDSGIGCSRKKDLSHFEETDLPPVSETSHSIEKKDIPLVVKLQTKLKELERENRKYRDDVNRRDYPCQDVIFNLSSLPLANVYEAFRIQELEIENASIRNQLSRLQKVLSDSASSYDVRGGKTKQLYDQFEALKEELKHKHNEVARLKTLLFKSQQQLLLLQNNNNNNTNSSFNSSNNTAAPGVGGEFASNNNNDGIASQEIPLNEDGELNMAYESQKKLNQLLEAELQRLQEISQLRDQDFHCQIESLNKEYTKQQKVIEESLELATDAKVESTVLFEISKITSENLGLHDNINSLQDANRKLRKAVKIFSKRLKESEVNDAQMELERELAMEDNMPMVKHQQQKEWMGMLEYKKEDEQILMRNLILDLKPEMMLKELPHLPAYILLMCIRHTDYMNDDEKVRSLLTGAISNVKRVVKKSANDIGRVVSWLSNSVRLLNNLKQYGGDKIFQTENTSVQNQQCLKNFDLSEYRLILNDLAVWIYQIVVKYAESKIQGTIVGAILEKDSIAGCTTGKPTGVRQMSVSVKEDLEERKEHSPEDIIKIMNDIMQNLCAHNVQFDVIKQIFRQIFFFICANALNTLLLRKDLCHWMKAVQIRYNISQLEQWVRDNKLNDGGVEDPLEPLIQATQLLQARKTEADVDSICDVCSKLTMPQIVKILNLYTPVNEFEERVPMSFIRKVQQKMTASAAPAADQLEQQQQSLMLDTKHLYAVSFDFKPSTVAIEQLNPPADWGLGFLKKV